MWLRNSPFVASVCNKILTIFSHGLVVYNSVRDTRSVSGSVHTISHEKRCFAWLAVFALHMAPTTGTFHCRCDIARPSGWPAGIAPMHYVSRVPSLANCVTPLTGSVVQFARPIIVPTVIHYLREWCPFSVCSVLDSGRSGPLCALRC